MIHIFIRGLERVYSFLFFAQWGFGLLILVFTKSKTKKQKKKKTKTKTKKKKIVTISLFMVAYSTGHSLMFEGCSLSYLSLSSYVSLSESIMFLALLMFSE